MRHSKSSLSLLSGEVKDPTGGKCVACHGLKLLSYTAPNVCILDAELAAAKTSSDNGAK